MSKRSQGKISAEELLGQQTVLAQFGDLALRSEDLDEILNEACRLVGRALETDLAKVMERRQGRPLLVRAGIGWKEGVVGYAEIDASESSSPGHSLETRQAMITPNIEKEKRFRIPDFLKEHGVKAMVNVIIKGGEGQPPFGVLEVDSRTPRDFTQNDISFLNNYANLIAAAVERIRILTALRSVIDEKQRLLTELQHRVKNNLQVITSLIRISAQRSNNTETRDELRAVGDRVETLKLVHERLYAAGEVDRIDLGAYIGELSASLIKFYGGPGTVRLHSNIQSLVISPDVAVPIGLIVNEFVTNSLKYAFDGHDGIVGVEVEEPSAGQARVTLWDDGKGLLEDAWSSGGTGLALIEGLARQIGTEPQWDSDAGGTKLTVEFNAGMEKFGKSANPASTPRSG